jgi:hypothetical protein
MPFWCEMGKNRHRHGGLVRAPSDLCPAQALRFEIVRKRPELDACRVACPG